MILVRDVKLYKTDKNWEEIAQFVGYNPAANYPTYSEYTEIYTEVVTGRHFVNYNGEDVVLGWDEATQTALGLPFEIFEKQEKRLEELRREVRELRSLTLIQFIKRKIFK